MDVSRCSDRDGRWSRLEFGKGAAVFHWPSRRAKPDWAIFLMVRAIDVWHDPHGVCLEAVSMTMDLQAELDGPAADPI